MADSESVRGRVERFLRSNLISAAEFQAKNLADWLEADGMLKDEAEENRLLDQWLDAETALAALRAKLRQVEEAAQHPFKGPHETDASMLLAAAKRLDGDYSIGGQHTRATVARILRTVARSILSDSGEPEPINPEPTFIGSEAGQ